VIKLLSVLIGVVPARLQFVKSDVTNAKHCYPAPGRCITRSWTR
jgi:hypothetical protein